MFNVDPYTVWLFTFLGPAAIAVVLSIGLLISGPNSSQEADVPGFWSGFYVVRQERPKWPISLGHMVEVLPPYRRGHGIVVWWFREKQADVHDWGWVPQDAIQIGWGRPREIGTWGAEDIASWQAPEDDRGQVLEEAPEAPEAGPLVGPPTAGDR